MATATIDCLANNVRPTDEQIDKLADMVIAAKADFEQAKFILEQLESTAASYVQQFGSVSPRSESSRKLAGALCELTVTAGNTTTVVQERVIELRDLLTANEREELFGLIYKPRTGYELQKDAQLAIKSANLNKRLCERVLTMFARTLSTSKKKPSVKVKRLAEKKPRKRAAKAAQKGGE